MTSDERAKDERAQLVQSAWTVLQRSGFEGFKVQLVMRGAGVSARTFYRHFADKDALILALLRDEMARAGSRLRAALAEVDDPIEQVSRWIRSVIDAADDPKRVARARLFSSQQTLMCRFPDEVADGTRLLVEPLRDAIGRGRDTGAFSWADPGPDAESIYRLTGGALTDALAARPHISIEDVVLRATGFALRALGVPPT